MGYGVYITITELKPTCLSYFWATYINALLFENKSAIVAFIIRPNLIQQGVIVL